MQETYFTEQLEDLLRRYDAKNPAAFDELIQLSIRRLAVLAHKRLTGESLVRRWQQTDDVLQNASIRLYRALKEVHPQTKKDFFTLAATMIRREILDMARQLRRPGNAAANYQSAPVPGDTFDSVRPWEGAENAPPDTRIMFHEAVESLEPELLAIVELVFYQGMSVPQAAATLGVSERTAVRRWREARIKIGYFLEK